MADETINETPVAPAADNATNEVEAPATVSIDVPAQHKTLLERIAAVLAKGEQWIVDNVEGGVAHFESLVGITSEEVQPHPDDTAKDA